MNAASATLNPGKPQVNKTWVLFLLVLMAVFLNADNLVLSPNLTVIGALVSLVWGYLADKGPRKLLFVLSIIIGELPCALTAFAQNYTQFFWLRILCGIGVGASYPIAFSLVADFFGEKERAKATGLVAAAISRRRTLSSPSCSGCR